MLWKKIIIHIFLLKEAFENTSFKIIHMVFKQLMVNRQYGHERYKISQKMKNKSLLSIEKNIIEWEKTLYYNYKKVF